MAIQLKELNILSNILPLLIVIEISYFLNITCFNGFIYKKFMYVCVSLCVNTNIHDSKIQLFLLSHWQQVF